MMGWDHSCDTVFAVENGLNICKLWFFVTLLANFYSYLCLRAMFHISLFLVPILAAKCLYWVCIIHKKLGPYF